MSELQYSQFDLLDGVIVIEDVAYEWSPDSWQGTVGEEAVRGETVRTLTQTRKNTVQPARTGKGWNTYANEQLTGSATNLYDDVRYIIRQTWNAGWSQAFMSWCMRDHLMALYTLQKGFWLMFDDEMSRNCAALQCTNAGRTQFITPTYPIAFYRAGDPDGQYSQDHLYYELRIDNIVVDWKTNPYRIDHEIGLVVFENAVDAASIVTLKYLWRAYVRIKEVNLAQLVMAQHLYTGTVTFEQLEAPLKVERFDDVITGEPCRECPGNKRIDSEDEECPGEVGPAATRQDSEGLTDWTDVANIEQHDGANASCTLALSGDHTEYLIGYEFNLPTPGDRTKRLSRFIGTIYASAPLSANILLESVRLVYKDEYIGPDKADGLPITATYQFEISITELAGYVFDFDDFANGFFGIAVKYTSDSNAKTALIDWMSLSACWEDTDEEDPPPTDCGCDVDGPPAEDIQNTNLTCTHREDTIINAPYAIPSDHYVHGVEITSLIEGANKGCAEPPTAEAKVDVRLKLNTVPSSFSSWYSKSHQPVRVVDHAYLNYLDATSDYSWGGKNDCWGKPIGGWSPALVNANGFKLEIKWDTACDPNQAANWSYVRTLDGHAVGIGIAPGYCRPDFDETWGVNGEYMNEGMWCDGVLQGTLSCLQEGTITHTFTWIGAGDAPSFVDIEVYSIAQAGNGDHDPSVPDITEGDNGLGDPFVMEPNGGWGTSEGTHVVRVPVVSGVAEYTLDVRAFAEQGPPLYAQNEPESDAMVSSTAQISPDSCVYPELDNVDVVVHHSSVCELGPNCYQSAVVTGWPTVYKGIGCGLAQSSDGSTDGAFTLLANQFGFKSLGANSRIVGIKVTGEYRVNPSYVRAGNLTWKAHIGSYSGARTGKTLAYPQTNAWTEFTVGGNGDFWDYGTVFAETGVTYPTATGAQLNSFFKLELLGDNDSGYVYEFRNIKVKIYYFDVCDGY